MKIFHLPESRDRFFGHMIGLCPGKSRGIVHTSPIHSPTSTPSIPSTISTFYHLYYPHLYLSALFFVTFHLYLSQCTLYLTLLTPSTLFCALYHSTMSIFVLHCPFVSYISTLCFHLYFISYLLSKLFLIFPILYFSLLYLYSVPPGISSPILLFSYCSSVPATRSSAN